MENDYNIVLSLIEADFKMRDELIAKGILSDSYHPEMERIHIENAKILQRLIENLGFPFETEVGKEIADASWLIIQHSISKPSFMKYCLQKMEENLVKSNPIHMAYLTDRIFVFENKPQLYGTQFDWNEKSELVPNEYDNLESVNQRRKKIGLNSLEEQIKFFQKQAKDSNQIMPKDFEKKREEMAEWKKRVGWI